jgi:hypothetical protein
VFRGRNLAQEEYKQVNTVRIDCLINRYSQMMDQFYEQVVASIAKPAYCFEEDKHLFSSTT